MDEADLLLTMTAEHKRRVEGRFPEAAGKVHTLLEFADQEGDIDDPFDRSPDVYEACARQIMQAVDILVDQLRTGRKPG